MQRIKAAILRWLAPSRTVYVVARTRDDKITDVEVYTDMDVATRRQRALGQGCTIMAERGVDDPRWARRKPSDYRVRGRAAATVLAGLALGYAASAMAAESHLGYCSAQELLDGCQLVLVDAGLVRCSCPPKDLAPTPRPGDGSPTCPDHGCSPEP